MSPPGKGLLLVAAAMTLLMAPGSASAAGVEGVPAGPPACSVDAKAARPAPRSVNFWLQCNVRLSSFWVTGLNRAVRMLSQPPELYGAAPGETVECGIVKSRDDARHRPVPWPLKGIHCKGRLAALARVHLRFKVGGKVCSRPRMRLGAYLVGSEECSGYCPGGPRLSFSTLSLADRRSLGCP